MSRKTTILIAYPSYSLQGKEINCHLPITFNIDDTQSGKMNVLSAHQWHPIPLGEICADSCSLLEIDTLSHHPKVNSANNQAAV